MSTRDRDQRREEMRLAKQQRQRKERIVIALLAVIGLGGIIWVGSRPAIETPVDPDADVPAVAPEDPEPEDPEPIEEE